MANKQTIIGKTAPVPLGQQKAVNSLPVVFAEDQPPIPVEEQNKIQSEVALSLLGIPRAEVALGIFADVNTYDVNPSEWSQIPLENDPDTGTGVNHLEREAGAELVASEGRTTVLTSKRFFRYQPGRVSSSTMGVKMNRTLSTYDEATPNRNIMKGAPTIKKWGIFDKFDGYYFEIVNSGDNNDFRCIRRTQALTPSQPSGYSWNEVSALSGTSNIKEGNWGVVGVDPVIYRNGLCYVAAAIYDPSLCYSPSNVRAVESAPNTLSDYEPNSGYAVRLAYRNSSGAFVEHLAGRQFQFPLDQREPSTFTTLEYEGWKTNNQFLKPASQYIRLDAHCRWEDIVTNLSRGGGADFTSEIALSGDALSVAVNNARFGYDTDPSEANSGVKVWNLLVTVQGSAQITNGEFDSAFGTDSHRSAGKEYDTASTDPGTRNVTLKEWFKICVPPQYRTVYEWRPVRAMFSNDQLNGRSDNIVRWSDVSTANVDPTVIGVKRPGDQIKLNGQTLTDASVYDVDFTKVTMWKIDFSWYGAVGALFLCYVPVANGEARWVRVHHMRASNQLDVASLGNATLPITYLTHSGLSNGLPNNKSTLVKYGASYYIDGGDKGTVKLLSKSSDYSKSVSYGGIKTSVATVPASNYFSILASTVAQADKDQLIGAYLKADTTMRVIWVENDGGSNVRLYFNKSTTFLSNGSSIELIVPRRQRAMIALRAKDEVSNTTGTPIRNRIQLYPIKYGIGITDPSAESNIVTVNFIKNPLLITNNLNNSSLSQSYAITLYSISGSPQFGFNLGSGTVPREIISGTNISSGDFTTLQNILSADGTYLHAYMRGIGTGSVPVGGFPTNPSVSETSILVRFFRKGSKYYVQNYAAQNEPVTVYGSVLPVRMYTFNTQGTITPFTGFSLTGTYSQSGTTITVNVANHGYEPGESVGLIFTTGSSVSGVFAVVTSSSNSFTVISANSVNTSGNVTISVSHSKYEDQKKWNDTKLVGSFESIAQLSGASVSQDFRLSPVANTGSTIFSLYSNAGGAQYDLADYFAYNKEYISYPLTNEVDILCAYAMWESTSAISQPNTQLSIVNSLTWEEQ